MRLRKITMATKNRKYTPDAPLSTETIFGLLAARQRRYALYCLYLNVSPMHLPDMAEQVAAWEHNALDKDILDERLHTYNNLYRTHVPKLAETNVIAYSESDKMIELDYNAAQLRPYLELAAGMAPTENDMPHP